MRGVGHIESWQPLYRLVGHSVHMLDNKVCRHNLGVAKLSTLLCVQTMCMTSVL